MAPLSCREESADKQIGWKRCQDCPSPTAVVRQLVKSRPFMCSLAFKTWLGWTLNPIYQAEFARPNANLGHLCHPLWSHSRYPQAEGSGSSPVCQCRFMVPLVTAVRAWVWMWQNSLWEVWPRVGPKNEKWSKTRWKFVVSQWALEQVSALAIWEGFWSGSPASPQQGHKHSGNTVLQGSTFSPPPPPPKYCQTVHLLQQQKRGEVCPSPRESQAGWPSSPPLRNHPWVRNRDQDQAGKSPAGLAPAAPSSETSEQNVPGWELGTSLLLAADLQRTYGTPETVPADSSPPHRRPMKESASTEVLGSC